jgi:hypothetical protein
MKTITYLLVLLLLHLSAFSQNTLHYDDLSTEEFYTKVKNRTTFNKYISSDGYSFEIGQKLKIGDPEFPEGVYNDPFLGTKYGNFTYLRQNVEMVMTLERTYAGETCTIKDIMAHHTRLTKKSPLSVSFICLFEDTIEGRTGVVIDRIEKAIESGEVINLNAPLTKVQAIAKLKEQKELLDLGLISIEEYEKIKAELSPIILKK